MQFNNINKTVIITGAARRIGRGLALRFAQAGYNLALHYNTSEQQAHSLLAELQHFPITSALYKADLRNDNEVQQMFMDIQRDFTSADILVSNAAVYPFRKSLDEISSDFIGDIFSTNCLAHYRCVKGFTSIAAGGNIVLFASLGAHETWKGRLPYNVSKVAALQLSPTL